LRDRSGRSIFVVKKNRNAATWLFIAGAGIPASRCSTWNADRDILIARPRVGGEQDLRSLELAGAVLAAAQQGAELVTLFLVQLDPVTYIHRGPCW